MSNIAKAFNTSYGTLFIVLLLLIATVCALGQVGGHFAVSLNFSVK